ncbi:ABC transporter ATP-binding protein [Clostridium hydrogeniformans]|uniref:ABC transporter ATP-binding protein n=1 Tax=Clostridium hydrogeniformans TaxID=349933 RepID=UPI00047F1517|nr:ABC transporter ATP-binding protein [Clostridium hydrogeniformans]
MDNFNDDELLTKDYDSNLMKRLLTFAKPFKLNLFIVMILMLISTVILLIRPSIIKSAIDDDLNGFKQSYIEVSNDIKNSTLIGDKFFISSKELKENYNIDKVYSLIYYDKEVYLVYGKVDYSKEVSLNNNKIYKKLSKNEIKSLRNNDITSLKYIVIILLLTYCLGFVINYFQMYILQFTGQKIIYNIRQKLFVHLESLNLSFFDKTPVGRLVTRITNDVQTLNEMYTGVLIYLIKDIFMLGGIVIAMFILNKNLALISISTLPIIFIVALLFKKYDRDAYRKVRSRLSRINSFLSENISGVKVVQIYNKEDKKFKEFDEINTSYKKASLEQTVIFAIFRPAIELLSSLTMALLIWFGGFRVLDSSIEFGVLFAFINYVTMFFQPIFDITEKYDILQSAMASSEKIFTILDNDSIIKNIDDPKKVTRLIGEIEFKNVWFAYNDEDWILKDVSFSIKPGEKVAFVGATGAGKTSIISLITRLYDIQKGEILIDGINIKHMKKEDLRRNIATVLQDVFLFTGDIKSNVRLNNTDISDEKVIEACKYVNANQFIEKLPKKYNDPVNERGTTFSQGERQLIAFARSIAFNPPILVLDEATSNIDTETESLIQDALYKITEKRTTILVAHRLSTIKNSDKIIVLHKGKIREMGTHEELLAKQKLYYNLYKLQYSEMKV